MGIPEFFPFTFRAAGKSFALTICSLYAIISVALYLDYLTVSAAACNSVVAAWFLVGSIYLIYKCPETKNKTPIEIFPEFAEIEELLNDKYSKTDLAKSN